LRDTGAAKSISGHYYAILNTISYLIELKEDDYIACEYRNSDIYIYKDNKCISIESKYYSSNIGWGDECFKNSIRNFIDIEINDPVNQYVFMTNTSKKDMSRDLNLWINLYNKNIEPVTAKEKETILSNKIRQLYVNEIYKSIVKGNKNSEKKEDELKKIAEENANKELKKIDLIQFIKKVRFEFDKKVNHKIVKEKIENYISNVNIKLKDDSYKIFACLQDFVWSNICDIGDEVIHKKQILCITDMNKLILNFEERYEKIINDYKSLERIAKMNLYGKVGEEIKNYLKEGDYTEDSEILEYFNSKIDEIIDEILECFKDEGNWANYIERMNNKTLDDVDTEDLANLIIYVAMLKSIYTKENNVQYVDDEIYNMKLGNMRIGYYISNRNSIYNKALSRWFSKNYKRIDIHKKETSENIKCILLNCNKLKECSKETKSYRNKSDLVIKELVLNIADPEENDDIYYSELRKKLMVDYHCGECIKITEKEKDEIDLDYEGVMN